MHGLLLLALSGCFAQSALRHDSPAAQSRASAYDGLAFAATEALAFTQPTDTEFYVGFSIGAVLLMTDMITAIVVGDP